MTDELAGLESALRVSLARAADRLAEEGGDVGDAARRHAAWLRRQADELSAPTEEARREWPQARTAAQAVEQVTRELEAVSDHFQSVLMNVAADGATHDEMADATLAVSKLLHTCSMRWRDVFATLATQSSSAG